MKCECFRFKAQLEGVLLAFSSSAIGEEMAAPPPPKTSVRRRDTESPGSPHATSDSFPQSQNRN